VFLSGLLKFVYCFPKNSRGASYLFSVVLLKGAQFFFVNALKNVDSCL